MKNTVYDQFIGNENINNNDIKTSLNAKSEPLPEKEEDIIDNINEDINEDINENINIMNINKNITYKTDNSKNLKTFSDNNSKISKLTLLDNFLYGKEFSNSENYKSNDFYNSVNQKGNIEINTDENIIHKNSKMVKSVNSINVNDNSNYNLNLDDESKNENIISNENNYTISRRTTRKRKYKAAPEKNRINNNNNNDDGIDLMKEYGSYNDCTLNLQRDLKCGCTGNFDEGCLIF